MAVLAGVAVRAVPEPAVLIVLQCFQEVFANLRGGEEMNKTKQNKQEQKKFVFFCFFFFCLFFCLFLFFFNMCVHGRGEEKERTQRNLLTIEVLGFNASASPPFLFTTSSSLAWSQFSMFSDRDIKNSDYFSC